MHYADYQLFTFYGLLINLPKITIAADAELRGSGIVDHPAHLEAQYFAREYPMLTHDVDATVCDQRGESFM